MFFLLVSDLGLLQLFVRFDRLLFFVALLPRKRAKTTSLCHVNTYQGIMYFVCWAGNFMCIVLVLIESSSAGGFQNCVCVVLVEQICLFYRAKDLWENSPF